MNLTKTSYLKALAIASGLIFALSTTANAADVGGMAKFTGSDKPKRKVVKMDADPKCAAMHDSKVGSVNVLVAKNRGIQNVFVYVKDGLSGEFDVPAEHAKITQIGCMYEPHVFGIQVGQTLDIVSEDNTLHNINCQAKVNATFNFGQPTPGTREKSFRKPEIGVKFKCDVHPWMSAYMNVVDNPFYAVTDKTGAFSITGLPEGEYTIGAWHEVFGDAESTVTVGADGVSDLTFEFGGE